MVVKYAAHGLDLGHYVEEGREESLSHGMGGPADYHDMFSCILWINTQVTRWAQVWLILSKPVVGDKIPSEKLEMVSQFLNIL